MPKWYRLNSSGSWTQLQSIYRLNSSGAWTKLKTIYRLNSSGSWGIVHSSADVPAATTQPTLINQVSSADNFYGGDTLTLKRGAYTNTTADSNTTYRMRIYKGDNSSLPLSNANWTVAAEATYTGANSSSNTSLTYSLTDADAFADYYLVGEVRVNNDANTSGSPTYDFETASRVLSRISFTVSGLTSSGVTSDDATLDWTVGGISNNSYVYSQRLIIRQTNSSGTIVQDVNPVYTARTYSFTNTFQPSTLYYAEIEVIADDGWRLTANPTKLTDIHYFTTQSSPPVNTVAPTIGPLNNRGYLPISTTLTATQGTWSNVSGTTTYAYDWWLEDAVSGSVTNTGYIGNTRTYGSSDVGDYLFVRVRATNSDGGIGTAVSTTYILDQSVAVSNVTPTTATQNVSTNFSFNISHYPTSYIVNWGDGTSDSYTVNANTSTVNANISHTYTTTGNKTVTITAQPGNKTSTTTISVAAPAPSGSGFSRSDSTVTPSQPSTLTFQANTPSTNQVTTSWINGSPISSVRFQGSGAGISTDYTDTSSPFMTSDISSYSSSGTFSATVTNFNNSLQVNVSWNQSNAQSYRVDYSSSVYGADVALGNNSASSVSLDIPFFGGGTFTWTGLTLYTGPNQTGTSTYYSNPVAGGLVPTQKSSSRSGSTFLTYVSPNLTAPTIYSVSQSTPGGSLSVYFTGGSGPYYQIWWQSSSDYSSVTSYDANGSSSPVTDTSGPSAGTWYVAVRSVSSLTNTGSGPSSTISAWSSPVQFTVSQPTYTVTWNANGGSVSPTSSTVNQGSSVTAPTPTRSGYTFLYWRDTPSGDYLYSVNAGAPFTPPYSITMYARWQVVSSGTAPSTPTGLTNTYSSGPSWTGSWSASSGTAPITYYYTLYQSASNGGSITATYSGSTTSTSFTRAMSSSNGLWAYFTVYASNAYGTSGTATSSWA